MNGVPIPERGEVWTYARTASGNSGLPGLAVEHMLIVSRNVINAGLPFVLAVPLESAPPMVGLGVELGDTDPMPGKIALAYRISPIYRGWLANNLGQVTEATMNKVTAAVTAMVCE